MAHPLVDLYVLDQALGRLEKRISENPNSLAEIRSEREKLEVEEEARRAGIEELSRAIRRLEQEGDVLRGKIRHKKSQMGGIQSVKASEAIQHEVSGLETAAEALELEALEKVDLLERQERETAIRGPVQEEKLHALAGEATQLERELTECEDDRRRMAEQREHFLEGLELDLRRRYLRIHKGHGYTALVALVDGACGGCGQRLPPQRAIDIQRRGEILVCQGCGRLILGVEE